MSPHAHKEPKDHLRDLAAFRASLWKALGENAKELTGIEVVEALRVISDDVYNAGVDSPIQKPSLAIPAIWRMLGTLPGLTALQGLRADILRQRRPPRRLKRATSGHRRSVPACSGVYHRPGVLSCSILQRE